MGGHHAVCGAAVWVGLTATAPVIPALHMLPMTPAETALGALLCAGAALGPDADHAQATTAHSAGIVSKAATTMVGAVSGGHRHGTHAPLVAVGVALLAWASIHYGWLANTARFTWAWWLCVAVICTMMLLAVKVLKLVPTWPRAWLVGLGTAAAVTLLWPDFLPVLPVIVAVGWCTHLAGDLLTTGGLPLAWPFRLPGPAFVPDAIWGKNGYFSLPVLGNVGSGREWLLCVPISLYALFGVAASMYALLPT